MQVTVLIMEQVRTFTVMMAAGVFVESIWQMPEETVGNSDRATVPEETAGNSDRATVPEGIAGNSDRATPPEGVDGNLRTPWLARWSRSSSGQ